MAVSLEIGHREDGRWRPLGSFGGRVSKGALDRWAMEHAVAPGTYELRPPGSDRPGYLFVVGEGGAVETVEVLDLD